VPLKELCVVFIIQKHNIVVFSFDALFGLTWRMLTPCYVTRVNSKNVQDEGLRIGVIGHRMNLKVRISQTRHVLRINVVINLAYSQSIPNRPLLAPIYR
jgi:hypothetical protein